MADGLAGPTTLAQQEYFEIILRNVEQLRVLIDGMQEAGRAQRA
jgi:hypothetical protein